MPPAVEVGGHRGGTAEARAPRRSALRSGQFTHPRRFPTGGAFAPAGSYPKDHRVHIRTTGGRHARRRRLAVPAAAVTVLALVGTALTMSTSQAEEPAPSLPTAAPERPAAPAESELRERVADASASDREVLPPAKFAGDGPGTAAPMVIGGTQTSISSAPWMAQLLLRRPGHPGRRERRHRLLLRRGRWGGGGGGGRKRGRRWGRARLRLPGARRQPLQHRHRRPSSAPTVPTTWTTARRTSWCWAPTRAPAATGSTARTRAGPAPTRRCWRRRRQGPQVRERRLDTARHPDRAPRLRERHHRRPGPRRAPGDVQHRVRGRRARLRGQDRRVDVRHPHGPLPGSRLHRLREAHRQLGGVEITTRTASPSSAATRTSRSR
ncbi:hypothetical protein SBADM41S_12274 [Streptomyces badius]